MTILLAAGVAVIAGAAGGITALTVLAIWATGPAVESESVGHRVRHSRNVIAACRADRRRRGLHDPYEGGYQRSGPLFADEEWT